MAIPEASVSITNGLVKSGIAKTGAEVKAFCSYEKAYR